MWPAAAAASVGVALWLKVRGDKLSTECDKAMDELEATEDDLSDVKKEVKALLEQVRNQESTIVEVSARA